MKPTTFSGKLWQVILLFLFLALPGHAERVDPSTPPDLMREFMVLRERLRRNPRDVATLNSLGIIYARAGRLNDAITLWNQAMAIEPRYIHLYNNLGSALKAQGRYDEAVRVYQSGLAISPSFWIYYNLGVLEKERARYPSAAYCFQQCLRLNPGFEAAAQKLRDIGYLLPSSGTPQYAGQGMGFKPPVSLAGLDIQPLDEKTQAQTDSGQDGGPDDVAGHRWKTGSSPSLPGNPQSIEECAAYIEKVSQGAPNRVVALTFDDGPHAEITPRILDLLRSWGAHATFFMLGSRAEAYPDLITRMVQEGSEIGNHTWNHKSLVRQGREAALADLLRTAEVLTGLSGKTCHLVRPPYGHTNKGLRELIHSQGWNHVMWDADSRDWQLNDASQMLTRILRSLRPGAVVLFHDIHPGALRVLPILLPALKRCGYRFVTISELIRLRHHTS